MTSMSQLTLFPSSSLPKDPPSDKGTFSPAMTISRNSLGAFLKQAKASLKRAIDQKEKVTLVIGNESAGKSLCLRVLELNLMSDRPRLHHKFDCLCIPEIHHILDTISSYPSHTSSEHTQSGYKPKARIAHSAASCKYLTRPSHHLRRSSRSWLHQRNSGSGIDQMVFSRPQCLAGKTRCHLR